MMIATFLIRSLTARVLLVATVKQIYLLHKTDLSVTALLHHRIASPIKYVYSFLAPQIKISMAALNIPHILIVHYFKLWPP